MAQYTQWPKVEIDQNDILTIKDPSGNIIEMFPCYGYYLPRSSIEKQRYPDPRKNIPDIIKMKTRHDDVFLTAYPKTGTHWLAEIIYMLLNQRLEYNTEYAKVSAMLPLQTPEMVDKLPSPRILNSHMLFSSLPRDILTQKNKVVFVNRNPKDVAVSLYHFCRHTINYEGSWNDFLQLFMSEGGMVYAGPWHKYMMDWDNVIRNNSKLDVLVVNYEDLKMNPLKEIERLAEYLDIKNSTDFYSQVADRCRFNQLKDDYKNRNHPFREVIFRKGDVGDWKNWFTVAQNEEFDKHLTEKLTNSSWTFKYSAKE
ncbi:sulfotransferase 1A1-like [Mytilus californianus]|uniref:sulfotransferase 1A1-like n=1 Tax=Mytilus californianus TaxID=6549 RepID=UPI0022470104|nr:sulfotransferase 1A1-like [Mytilus californianus]XP_052065375.1 sulfotransferase 1A1-like [Mytilus californianus]